MKKSDCGLEIRKVEDGFIIKDNEGNETLATKSEHDELAAAEDLLNQIISYFDLRGSKYDRERIWVVRKIGEKYTPQENEGIVYEHYPQLAVTKRHTRNKRKIKSRKT